jgi:hypothetical protein
MRVHLTYEGGNVYSDTFLSTAVVDGVFRPTLLLVVTRLGVDSVNPIYWDALKATLQMPQTVGIAGYCPPSSPLPNIPANPLVAAAQAARITSSATRATTSSILILM